jgi:hypothetical protein
MGELIKKIEKLALKGGAKLHGMTFNINDILGWVKTLTMRWVYLLRRALNVNVTPMTPIRLKRCLKKVQVLIKYN